MKKFMLLLATILITNIVVQAETNPANTKAMFIYNFLRYVNWPEHVSHSEYIIGVAGETDVYEALVEYAKKRELCGKTIRVIKCRTDEDMLKCHLLYISNSNSGNLSKITGTVRNSYCLTIFDNGESSRPSKASIDLLSVNDKIGYRVNTQATTQKNIKLSHLLVNMSM